MGLFDAVKKAFDAGGIKVGLEVPKSFQWSDESIPVTVTLTGHKTEPRTVTAMAFKLEEDDDDDRGTGRPGTRISTGSGGSLSYTRTETIELQPLQVVTVGVSIPLKPDAAVTSEAGWVGKVVDAIAMLGTIRFNSQWYKLSVHTTVEGAAASKGTSKRIRNGDVSFSASFSIG